MGHDTEAHMLLFLGVSTAVIWLSCVLHDLIKDWLFEIEKDEKPKNNKKNN